MTQPQGVTQPPASALTCAAPHLILGDQGSDVNWKNMMNDDLRSHIRAANTSHRSADWATDSDID